LTTHGEHGQDTQQLEPHAAGSCAPSNAAQAADAVPTGCPADDGFPATQLQPRDDDDSRWWAEAADGRCSDEAAQFAASQPAPLSIV
jgi:hypothetical protein